MNKSWIISIIICILLGGFFGYVYFHNHAWGTWGDDSAGYIYLWGKMDQDKPLVYQEPLTVASLEHFGEEKLSRWTTPTHHEVISPSGYIASKYPIGLSLLMYAFSEVFSSDQAVYYVLPLLATLNLILLFLIANLIFQDIKYKHLFSLLAAMVLGLASLYHSYALAQPMREIPSMFFILAGYYCLLLFISWKAKTRVFAYGLLILSALCLGYSMNIRETSLMVLPGFFALLFWGDGITKKRRNTKDTKEKTRKFKEIMILSVVGLAFLIIALIPSINNSIDISKYKEKFKNKDISSVAITSNFDHISSLSLHNIFDNQGKFRPGRGALPHYWNIMQNISVWPCFIALAAIGLLYMYKRDKILATSLLLWLLGILTIFSIWVNPYSRYILPLFPVLAILGSFGLYNLLSKIVPYFFAKRRDQIVVGIIIILSLLFIYQPVIAEMKDNLTVTTEEDALGEKEYLVYKSISKEDLANLKDLGEKIKTESTNKTPLVIFSGVWQYGISETFEAHTGVQSIRMPLEQKKFVFDSQQVKDFFDKYLINDYNVYIWIDGGTKTATQELMMNYSLQNKFNYIFSFEPNVNIYGVTTKN